MIRFQGHFSLSLQHTLHQKLLRSIQNNPSEEKAHLFTIGTHIVFQDLMNN